MAIIKDLVEIGKQLEKLKYAAQSSNNSIDRLNYRIYELENELRALQETVTLALKLTPGRIYEIKEQHSHWWK